jgi:hypothetical protein
MHDPNTGPRLPRHLDACAAVVAAAVLIYFSVRVFA